MGEQVDGEVNRDTVDEPDGKLFYPLADNSQRPAQGQEGTPEGEEQGPGQVRGDAEEGLSDAAGRFGHDDDLKGPPADQLDDVKDGGEIGAVDAQDGAEHHHRGDGMVAADDPGDRQQEATEDTANEDGQQGLP